MASLLPASVRLPPGDQTVTVKLINPVNFGPAQIHRFMAPPVPELETFATSPSLCFLLEHPSGRRLVWDLGIRKDFENYSPSIEAYLPTTGYTITIDKSVAEILQEGGVGVDSVEAVIWRLVLFAGGKIAAYLYADVVLATGTGTISVTHRLFQRRRIWLLGQDSRRRCFQEPRVILNRLCEKATTSTIRDMIISL